jgi:hypothetical protein
MQTASITLYPRRPARRTRLARLGDWMARHRRAILIVQWLIVVFYLVLVALPAFLPHPHPEARLFSSDFGASSAIDRSICTTGALRPRPLQKRPPTSPAGRTAWCCSRNTCSGASGGPS